MKKVMWGVIAALAALVLLQAYLGDGILVRTQKCYDIKPERIL